MDNDPPLVVQVAAAEMTHRVILVLLNDLHGVLRAEYDRLSQSAKVAQLILTIGVLCLRSEHIPAVRAVVTPDTQETIETALIMRACILNDARDREHHARR